MAVFVERELGSKAIFSRFGKQIKDGKAKFKLKSIFKDHWTDFIDDNPTLEIRNVVHKNVDKLIKCATPALGLRIYKCDTCDNEHFHGNTCKSRFCSSCGVVYNENRSNNILKKIFNYKHRHVVFTIPSELRKYFREDRKRLNILFQAVNDTITFMFYKRHKNRLTPAFISTLHTFGRSLVWNPHIHVVLLEAGLSDNNFVKLNFFNYASFRKSFMKVVLDLLSEDYSLKKDKEFKELKNYLYQTYTDGFYVYAPPNKFKQIKEAILYITRYVGRPVMAESRILDYDGEYVTFWYERHDDKKLVIEKIEVYDFIKRLIIHIPNEQFKMIRYYGAYCKKHPFSDKVFKLLNSSAIWTMKQLSNWKMRIYYYFNRDILECEKCNGNMVFMEYMFIT